MLLPLTLIQIHLKIMKIRERRSTDSELDLGTKIGPGRPKNKSAQNGFKTDMCVGFVDTNPMQLEQAQTNIV
jgi:hypothetical protein